MTFLGACCGEQQGKQNSKQNSKRTCSLSTDNRKQNTLQALAFAIIFLLVMVVSTVSAQQAKVRLELLTTGNSIVNRGNTSQLALAVDSFVGLRVASDRNAFIYIYNFDAAGNMNLLTNPNDNYLQVNQPRTYPENHGLYKVSGPVGRESIFAIASNQPLNQARLQQLQRQHVQAMSQSRGLVSGGGSMVSSQPSIQDGWLADSIIFDVARANGVSSVNTQTPTTPVVTQAPQAPVLTNPTNNQLPSNTPVSPTVTAANFSGFNNNPDCILGNLNLQAPKDSQGFKHRCVNKTFDGSFGSPASMNDVLAHFGQELVNNGFSYQGMLKNDPQDFRGTFIYQQKTYQMKVLKRGQFFRFELLEFNPLVMGY